VRAHGRGLCVCLCVCMCVFYFLRLNGYALGMTTSEMRGAAVREGVYQQGPFRANFVGSVGSQATNILLHNQAKQANCLAFYPVYTHTHTLICKHLSKRGGFSCLSLNLYQVY
jgi:hypothetical protein